MSHKTHAMNLQSFFVSGLIIIVLSGFLIVGVSSCRHEDDIQALPEICFEADILPVFLNSCGDCHFGDDIDLTTYAGIIQNIVPGDAGKSKLYKAMTNTWSSEMMPPDRPVSLQNRTKIKLWIEQGAKETCP